MGYYRVIPRDLFNEAKLLKCFGRLSLLVHDLMLPDGVNIEINHDGEAFKIEQDFNSGDLYINNIITSINNSYVTFKTKLNSKDNYPLICEYQYDYYNVFDDSGEFTEEFIEFAKNIGNIEEE
jgi:hypothetical protein